MESERCPCSLCPFEALNKAEFRHHLRHKHKLDVVDVTAYIKPRSPWLAPLQNVNGSSRKRKKVYRGLQNTQIFEDNSEFDANRFIEDPGIDASSFTEDLSEEGLEFEGHNLKVEISLEEDEDQFLEDQTHQDANEDQNVVEPQDENGESLHHDANEDQLVVEPQDGNGESLHHDANENQIVVERQDGNGETLHQDANENQVAVEPQDENGESLYHDANEDQIVVEQQDENGESLHHYANEDQIVEEPHDENGESLHHHANEDQIAVEPQDENGESLHEDWNQVNKNNFGDEDSFVSLQAENNSDWRAPEDDQVENSTDEDDWIPEETSFSRQNFKCGRRSTRKTGNISRLTDQDLQAVDVRGMNKAHEDKLNAKAKRANSHESQDEEAQEDIFLQLQRGKGDGDDVNTLEILHADAGEDGIDDNTIKPYRIDTFVNTTRFIAKNLFEEHANSGKAIKTCPKSLDPKHGAIYIFQLDNKKMTDINRLDALKWRNDTSKNTNKDTLMMYYPFTGLNEDKSRDKTRKKIIIIEEERNRFLVHYFKMTENVAENVVTENVLNEEMAAQMESTNDIEVEVSDQDRMKAVPHIHHQNLLSHDEADQIFEQVKRKEIKMKINNPELKCIENPKGGEVYIFDVRQMKGTWLNHLKQDSYQWVQQKGTLDIKHVYGRKRYIALSFDEGQGKYQQNKHFVKIIWSDYDSTTAIFQYYGQANLIHRGPHLNSRLNDPFFTANPTVSESIKAIGSTAQPQAVVHELNSTLPAGILGATLAVRGADQVKYQQRKIRDEFRIKSDTLKNLSDVFKELPDFALEFRIQPTLHASLMAEDMKEEIHKILENVPIDQPLLNQMDTTFGLGDYFGTPYGCKHPLLERRTLSTTQVFPEPFIIWALELHEIKLQSNHKQFLLNMTEAIDAKYAKDDPKSFANRYVITTTDAEFQNEDLWSFSKPNPDTIKTTACWLHIQQNLEHKLRECGYNQASITEANSDLKWLLESSSKEQYDSRKEQLKTRGLNFWSNDDMLQYFEQKLEKVIKEKGAKYYLESIGVPNPELGVTSNAVESFHHLLKKQASNQKHNIAESILLFYYHQRIQASNCEMALYGRGPYKLKPEYEYLKKDIAEYPGQHIATVKEMQQNIKTLLNDESTCEDSVIENEDLSQQKNTVEFLAEQIYEKNKIQLMTEDNRFVVEETSMKKYVLNLGNMTCECGFESCSHMRALIRKCNLAEDFGDPKRLFKKYRMPLKAYKRRAFMRRHAKAGKEKPRGIDKVPTYKNKSKKVRYALRRVDDDDPVIISDEDNASPGRSEALTNDAITGDITHTITEHDSMPITTTEEQIDVTAESEIIIQMDLKSIITPEAIIDSTTQPDNITTEKNPEAVRVHEANDEEKEKDNHPKPTKKRKIAGTTGHLFSKEAKTGVLTRGKKDKGKAEKKKNDKEDDAKKIRERIEHSAKVLEKIRDEPILYFAGMPIIITYGSDDEEQQEQEQQQQQEK